MSFLQSLNNMSCKIFKNFTRNGLKWQQQNVSQLPMKSLWSSVAIAYNRVDTKRLQHVGPDRLCAEWVIKNGGGIRTVEASDRIHRNYNILPPENQTFKVKTIDGSDSSIMKMGFEHLKGCKHIDTVILHTCKHLEEDSLVGLVQLKDTLRVLEVSDCDNIRDDGLMPIGELKNLQELKIFKMPQVQHWENVKQKLSGMLPKCHIDIKE